MERATFAKYTVFVDCRIACDTDIANARRNWGQIWPQYADDMQLYEKKKPCFTRCMHRSCGSEDDHLNTRHTFPSRSETQRYPQSASHPVAWERRHSRWSETTSPSFSMIHGLGAATVCFTARFWTLSSEPSTFSFMICNCVSSNVFLTSCTSGFSTLFSIVCDCGSSSVFSPIGALNISMVWVSWTIWTSKLSTISMSERRLARWVRLATEPALQSPKPLSMGRIKTLVELHVLVCLVIMDFANFHGLALQMWNPDGHLRVRVGRTPQQLEELPFPGSWSEKSVRISVHLLAHPLPAECTYGQERPPTSVSGLTSCHHLSYAIKCWKKPKREDHDGTNSLSYDCNWLQMIGKWAMCHERSVFIVIEKPAYLWVFELGRVPKQTNS